MSKSTCSTAATNMVATKLLGKVLLLRKAQAGALLKELRSICKMEISSKKQFGDGIHTKQSEPFFYESAYIHDNRPRTLYVDSNGLCRSEEESGEEYPRSWKCGNQCKPLSETNVDIILNFKSGLSGESVREVRKLLDKCNDCSNGRYTNSNQM